MFIYHKHFEMAPTRSLITQSYEAVPFLGLFTVYIFISSQSTNLPRWWAGAVYGCPARQCASRWTYP